MKLTFILMLTMLLASCSVFGNNGVESAPYNLLLADEANSIEVRHYEPMILVSTSMGDDRQSRAFRKLFEYISGNNQGATDIAMTAPVFMDNEQANPPKEGRQIAMTAPVFMAANSEEPSMSFVMPDHFTLASTPKPNDPSVTVSKVESYKAVAIKFSGTLSKSNVAEHTKKLRSWMHNNRYQPVGEPVKAGYDGPFTLPFLRHNEVLIAIE